MTNVFTCLMKKKFGNGNGSGMNRERIGNGSVWLRKVFCIFLVLFIGIGNAWGTEGTLTITRTCFPSGALDYNVTDAWSATASTGGTISGYGDIYSTNGQTTLQTKNAGVSSHYYNTTILPGAIKSITVNVASGEDRVYNVYASATASISSTTGLSIIGTVSGGCSLELSTAYGYKYFALVCTVGASILNNINITYETSPESVIFSRVSSLSELEDGDEIIFVNRAENAACSLIQNDNNRGTKSISVNGDHQYTYSASDSVQIFTVKIDNGNYGFHTKAGYIYSASSSKNYLKTNPANICSNPSGTNAWTLSVSSNVFSIQNVTNTAYYIQFSGSTFSQYSTDQTKPFIFKHFSPHTVSWETNGDEWTAGSPTTSGVIHGSKVTTLPTPPTSSDCDDSKVFVGWSATPIVGETNTKPSDLFTTIAGSPAITDDVTFYAVFATSGSVTKTFSFDITPTDFNTTSYEANNNEKTSTATATDASGITTDVNWTSYQVMKSSSDIQFQKGAGYIYNNTDLGTVNSVTYTASAGTLTTWYGTTEHPTSGSQGSGKGYCTVKETGNSAAGKTTSITVNFTKTVTVYSEYATNCEAASLESITVKTAPTKTVYCEGEDFDPTGLVITLHYDDASTTDLPYAGNSSNFSFSPSEDLQDDNNEVTISCGGQSVTQSISVHDPYTITLTNSGSADHGLFTASASTSCEGETITLTPTADTHYSFSSWTITKAGGGEVTPIGNTFVMPEDNVTINATFTENPYKLVSFSNNKELITSYTDVKVYVGERPTPPTLTDGTSNDACDATSDKHYGWTRTIWSSTINQSALDAKTDADVKVYRKEVRLPVVAAGDPSSITYHAVWAEGTMTAGQVIGYELVDAAPDDWSGYYVLSTGTYTATGKYNSGYLTCDEWDPTKIDYEYNREFIIAKIGETSNYSIKLPDDSKYIGFSGGSTTNLVQDADGPTNTTPETAAKYPWTLSTSGIVNVKDDTRQLAAENATPATKFRAYATSGVPGTNAAVKLYKRKLGEGLVYSNFMTYCSKIFTDATDDHKWSTPGNWTGGVPSIKDLAKIQKPVTVDVADAKAKEVVLDQTTGNSGKLEISAGKALVVKETLKKTTDGETLSATAENDIIINSDEYGAGALVMGNYTGGNKATVNFYSLGRKNNQGKKIYQYIGTPFDISDVLYNYYGSWMYSWDVKNQQWKKMKSGDPASTFYGYCISNPTTEDHYTYWMQGELASTANKTITMVYNDTRTENVLANSWTAPISINALNAGATFTNCEKTIYIFNAGSDAEYAAHASDAASSSATSAGTYITLPISSSAYTNPSLLVIPSMQAFSVYATAASPSLTLDYTKVVYEPVRDGTVTIVGARAPRRVNAETDDPLVVHLRVSGDRFSDQVYMLEREDFSDEFDNGWDGRKMEGLEETPTLYAVSPDGNMAVDCVPELEGTLLGFKAGEDSQYTFSFDYDEDAEDLYLFDIEERIYTRVVTGNTYLFMTSDNEVHNRFLLTRHMPQMPTGINDTGGGETKIQKVIIDDHIYIIRDGKMYDAIGILVK